MKRILSLMLCLALTVLALVSCGNDEIGSYRDQYEYEPEVKEDVTLEVYLAIEDIESSDGLLAVTRMINQYTQQAYKTTLNLHYLPADTYREDVAAAIAAGKTVDILLLDSFAMMDDMVAAGSLADLTAYYAPSKYGTLKTKISTLLLNASLYTENVIADDGKTTVPAKKYYSVPNNGLAGSYDYLLIHQAMGEKYNFGPGTMAAYTSYEETLALREAIALGEKGDAAADVTEYVRTVKGTYNDRASYVAEGYVCNVISHNTPAREDAYSAFAIHASSDKKDRAMEIIYAINTDAELRNLLQWGVANVNYTLHVDPVTGVESVTRITTAGNGYFMNPFCTGNVFATYYSEDPADGWTPEVAEEAQAQNRDLTSFFENAS